MKTVLGLVLTLGTLLAQSAVGASDPNTLIAKGRAFLVQRDLPEARKAFAAAVAAAPDNETANVLLAATRVLDLPTAPAGKALLDRLGVSGDTRNVYRWDTTVPKDTNGVPLAPAGVDFREGRDWLRNQAIPELSAAEANLAKVTHATFLLTLTSNETSLAEVTLDYGDVLMARAMLKGAEFYALYLAAHDQQLPLSELRAWVVDEQRSIEAFLAAHPQLLAFGSPADLAAAGAAIDAGVARYLEASTSIRNRLGTDRRLFSYDPEMADREEQFRQLLTDLRASLSSPKVLHTDTNLTASLGTALDTHHPLRSLLPEFHGNGVVLGRGMDETFGGILTGYSRGEIDEVLGQGLELVPCLAQVEFDQQGRLIVKVHTHWDRSYGLRVSEDLQSWEELGRTVSSGELWQVVDAGYTGHRQRFYAAAELAEPANDDLAHRATLEGDRVNSPAITRNATTETWEAGAFASAGWRPVASVWWSWIAPRSGVAVWQGEEKAGAVAVFRFTGGNSLTPVALPAWPAPSVQFQAEAGVEYVLLFDGRFDDRSRVWIDLYTVPPPNDAFAKRSVILTTGTGVEGYTFGASREANEPMPPFSAIGHTVWYTWTAPATARYTATVTGLGMWLGVLYGLDFGSIDILGGGGDYTFEAKGGFTYQLVVDAYNSEGEQPFVLTVAETPAPANDLRANAQRISLLSEVTPGTTVGATMEEADDQLLPDWTNFRHSVWYVWRAPANGQYEVRTTSVNQDWPPYVVAQSAADSSSVGAWAYHSLTINATAMTDYYIGVVSQERTPAPFEIVVERVGGAP